MAEMRLDKCLAEMGYGSRSQIKEAVRKGRVLINGVRAKSGAEKIESQRDRVSLDGREIFYVGQEYYMLHKPAGVVSAVEDRQCQTVMDLIREKARNDLFPVGRLDKDTEGLLLITNDGALCHKLLSPKNCVEKIYYVETDRPIPKDAKQKFAKGVDIGEGVITLPARLELLGESSARLAIQEGKFHQVKRMFQAIQIEVIYLKRLSMGSLKLDETLSKGNYRPLTKEELEELKKI